MVATDIAHGAGDTSSLSKDPAHTHDAGIVPYCGMRSLFRAAQILDLKISLATLIKPQYISTKKGSSAADIAAAANDIGLYTEHLSMFTSSILRQSRQPVILHVKSSFRSTTYDHWVLFAGVKNGNAIIYDESPTERLVSFSALNAMWDGSVVIISDSPISGRSYLLTSVVSFAFFVCIAICAILILYEVQASILFHRNVDSMQRCIRFCANEMVILIILSSLVVAVVYSLIPSSCLSHKPSIAVIQDVNLAAFLPKVTMKEVAQFINEPDVTVIDSRLPFDFGAGHIDAALNIPVATSFDGCRVILSGVPVTNRIIIYCQGSGCPYSAEVARKVTGLGYPNVFLFHGGWNEWEAAGLNR